jgi:hypothetical protein
MKKIATLLLAVSFSAIIQAQINTLSTNPVAESVMLGDYNPGDFKPSTVIDHPDDIVQGILAGVAPDSLKAYLLQLSTYHTRNTGSDTASATIGIGAARRWVYEKFQQFSAENEGRLLPSYLQFDRDICGMGQHRNIFAVLPGLDTSDKAGIILIEAHIDSRCESVCDVACLAHGMEDNGSGTALVIELARVMSKFAFDHTLVFMATIGEEQGLYGADAFAKYAKSKGIPIKAVLNNDIVGGIICGETSSPPSCSGVNHVDSTQVRLFSAGFHNSIHKQLARFIKLEYQEELKDIVAVPMTLTIMSGEDRQGRGGDHIPFRQQGFPAMRFTSANEHGDAGVGPDYHDRQHTTGDILGVDTDGDSVLDSFFVDFNYCARNTVINGVAAGMAAVGPVTPAFTAGKTPDSIYVTIHDPLGYGVYRIFVRSSFTDFDYVYTVFDTVAVVPRTSPAIWVSVASVDVDGIESIFSHELNPPTITSTGEILPEKPEKNIELFQNYPNPFDEATFIVFVAHAPVIYKEAFVRITDMHGKEVSKLPVQIRQGLNEVLYFHGYNTAGIFAYSLVVDGKVIDSKRMVFAN